jgi:hypothetical protein
LPAKLKPLKTQITKTAVSVDLRIIGEPRVVTPELAAILLKQYPNLAKHACKSGKPASRNNPQGNLFGSKISGAMLPHLVEHLAIELLVQADNPQTPRPYAGATSWLSHTNSTMRVRVSYYDPDKTTSAILNAVSQINKLVAV